MNILFVSISSIPNVCIHSISLDLLHEFKRNGHRICILCALEKTNPKSTYYAQENGFEIVRVRIGGNKKANVIEKGITTVREPHKYIAAIKSFYNNVRFDLVLYPTPPITQVQVVEYIKKRDGANSYLLLKDIFPQNAADIGMLSKTGVKGVLYKYFRRKEKRVYKVSDRIGCMSQANVDYVIKHNPEVDPKTVEFCPNCLKVIDKSVDDDTREQIREKYGIPQDKKVFVYGGNLGKPQGVPFIIECLQRCANLNDAFFLVVGNGTEYRLLKDYEKSSGQKNFKLMSRLSRDDYDSMVGACDVGLIFLDHRFTIPNFPSRLLSYMQAKVPVLAVTDPNTDIGKVITEGEFGWWCESNNSAVFRGLVESVLHSDTDDMKEKEFSYLLEHYAAEKAYNTILTSVMDR